MGDEHLIQHLYERFNARDIDALADDVAWANGMEGTHVHGKSAVRDYWAYQWSVIDPHVEPLQIRTEGGAVVVTVHQTVRDLAGGLLLDETIEHAFRLEAGLVKNFDIQSPSKLSSVSH